MQVGDLVWFNYKTRTRSSIVGNTAIVIKVYDDDTEQIEIMWDDGEVCVYDCDDFEVINESR